MSSLIFYTLSISIKTLKAIEIAQENMYVKYLQAHRAVKGSLMVLK